MSEHHEFQLAGGDAILRLVLQVANDIIPFDAHRVFLSWTDKSESLWHFPFGFLEDDAFQRDIQRARSFDRQLAGKLFTQFEDDTPEGGQRQIALFRVRLSRDVGHICIARDERTANQATATMQYKTFSKVELQQLSAIGSLLSGVLSSAKDDTRVRNTLERLYLNFLDRRTLLQEVSADEIMDEYLGKALHILHDVPPKTLGKTTVSSGTHSTSMTPRIRLTIKLINDNGMALAIAKHGSTFPEEWTVERAATLYELPDSGEPAASITAKVFLECRSFHTNSYGTDNVPTQKVFDDTCCHISAPIIAGHGNVIGVLAVETTDADAYDDILANAFTLLAGHLAWPLRRAIQRTEFAEVEKAFVDDLWNLRTETKNDRLLMALECPLVALGYPRGAVCEVDYNTSQVVGKYSWGGSKMEHVKTITDRRFDTDARDCQILAVTERRRQQIRKPSDDPRVHPDSLAKGELKPFSVYPVVDNHGIPRWTLHVERRDAAPLGESDDRRISALCNRVMKASEESRRTAFERSFYEHILRTGFFSFSDVLRQFAATVVRSRIAVRCRIFLVSDDGVQRPFYQAGELQADDFLSVAIGERDLDIRKEAKPVLCIRKGYRSDLQNSGDDEFRVLSDCEEPHLGELRNEHRSQWVEAPVQFEGNTAAKIVFDHSIAPGVSFERQLGKDDAFTLGELRLIARLSRMLGIAAEVAEAYRVIAGLCCAGIHGRMLWHFVQSATQNLFKLPNLPNNVKRELVVIRDSLTVLRSVLSRRGTNMTPTEPVTVGGELAAAVEAIRPFALGIQLPRVNADEFNWQLPVTDRSLFLVVLTLLENCIKYIHKGRHEGNDGRVDFEIAPDNQPMVAIDIVDNGVGFETEEAIRIRSLFDSISLEFLQKEEGALSYVAFLAREQGWRLSLEGERSPTRIRLMIATRDSGGES